MKLSTIKSKIKEEDPKACSKIDFLGEAEHMYEELTKFNQGIKQSLMKF